MSTLLTSPSIKEAPFGTSLWDENVKGLHLRVGKNRRSFFLYYVTRGGKERRPKLGDWPTMTLDRARAIAKEMKEMIAVGKDPVAEWKVDRSTPTLKELSQRYMEKHGSLEKHPKNDSYILNNYVLPRLGTEKAKDITHSNIEDLHRALKSTPYMANRTLALLSNLFNLAEKWGYRDLNSNPCKHVKRFREEKRRRYMKPEEAAKISEALEYYSAQHPQAVAFLYLLILTGARKSEIANAQWDCIDGNRLELPDGKTGARTIFLPPPAMKLLSEMPRTGKTITGIQHPRKCWIKILARAGISGLRIHDLRHSFASAALSAGLSLSQIGELLGHRSTQTTKRYAHLVDETAHQAADMTAQKLLSMMGAKPEHTASL